MASPTVLSVVAAMAGQSVPSSGDNVAMRQLLRRAPAPLQTRDALEEALLSQWLSWIAAAPAILEAMAPRMEDALRDSAFLAGHSLSGADLVVYVQLVERDGIVAEALEAFPCLARWLRTVQHALPPLLGESATALLPKTSLDPSPADLGLGPAGVVALLRALPRRTGAFVTASATTPAAAATDGGQGKRKGGDGAKEDGVQQAQEIKGVPAEAPAGKNSKKEKKKKEKKTEEAGAAKSKGSASGDASAELLPTVLEIRVGVMQKVWAHEDADKLYCEEIDLGEEGGGVRNIASGLREFYSSADELTGRRVLVVCNLKPKNARGFPSNGMVLCASNADHTVVKLLEPPATAAIGERVTFDGLEPQEPMKPNAMAKKKILEKLGPEMVTNGDGVANFRGHVFQVGGDVCRAEVPNGMVA